MKTGRVVGRQNCNWMAQFENSNLRMDSLALGAIQFTQRLGERTKNTTWTSFGVGCSLGFSNPGYMIVWECMNILHYHYHREEQRFAMVIPLWVNEWPFWCSNRRNGTRSLLIAVSSKGTGDFEYSSSSSSLSFIVCVANKFEWIQPGLWVCVWTRQANCARKHKWPFFVVWSRLWRGVDDPGWLAGWWPVHSSNGPTQCSTIEKSVPMLFAQQWCGHRYIDKWSRSNLTLTLPISIVP